MSTAPRRATASWRPRLRGAAKLVQTGSAVTLGALIVTHLAAPVVAALTRSPTEHANQVMLLGRVYYQHPIVEPVLVWGALSVHTLASLVCRALQPRLPLRAPTRWTWRTWHSVAGVALVPILLVHAWSNRLAPSVQRAPICELSPSELDMSYVAWGFAHAPALSTIVYTWLCVASAIHVVGGVPKLTARASRGRPKWVGPAALVVAGLLLVGTWRIAREGLAGLAPSMHERIAASYKSVWPWRMGIASM